ncbi:MAG TPA: type IV toxin-antitoxin system AbiEi family antitoxin domain-containing protein [Dermatophilaceae bacterium]|nr:type IV toxin-antitoxin system AbiEi family antitoxin domain-containing protein [Dermatophilaceae bacterium]
MNGLLPAIADAQEGLFTATDATRAGLDHAGLGRLLRQGKCRRLTHGVYSVRDAGPRPVDDHAALAKAVLMRYRGRAVASHLSAVVLHRLPVYRVDLRTVHLTSLTPTNSRRRREVRLHRLVPGGGLARVGPWPTVSVAVALVQLAAMTSVGSAVVSVDAALHSGLVTTNALNAAMELLAGRVHTAIVRPVLDHADGRSESPGESLVRVGLTVRGLRLVPQVRITDRQGRVIARVDLLVEGTMVVIEFDGMVKYRGEGGEAALIQEKLRENELRRMGYTIVRVTWSDLSDLDALAARVRDAVAQSRP